MIPTRLLLTLLALAGLAPVGLGAVAFNREVRPILSDKCFACHGLDAKERKSELRLDTPEGAYGKAESGAVAIKPGDVKGSELWARINAEDKDELMPPPKTHKTLSAAEKATLRLWIEEGAKYQRHWSFEPPVKAVVPALPPEIAVRNPVDAFLFDRLKREGLAPLPEADQPTLIRRVTFALTGLPPTVEEVAAFLQECGDGPPEGKREREKESASLSPSLNPSVSPSSSKTDQAYERAVDRLLASPRYGEQMARHWLDVARYGDTHGLHLDNERSMWPYRD